MGKPQVLLENLENDRAELLGLTIRRGEGMKRIRWYRKLYLTERARKKRYKIVWRVNHKAGLLNTYLIILPQYGNNQLEIINSTELLQKRYDDITTYVVGVAIGKEEALTLVEKIVDDVVNHQGRQDVKEFFLQAFAVSEEK